MNQVRQPFSQLELISNMFEIKFSAKTFKYSVELSPDATSENISIISQGLKKFSSELREKFGRSYIFVNNAIYSVNVCDNLILEINVNEVDYTIRSNIIPFIFIIFS